MAVVNIIPFVVLDTLLPLLNFGVTAFLLSPLESYASSVLGLLTIVLVDFRFQGSDRAVQLFELYCEYTRVSRVLRFPLAFKERR